LSHNNGPVGEFNCRTVGGGTIKNPVGGGAGVGRINSLTSYECKAPECEKQLLAIYGVQGRGTITAQNNPGATNEPAFPGWNNVLEESTVEGVSSVREKIGEPFETFKTPSPPGMIRLTFVCKGPPTEGPEFNFIFEGELKPEIGIAKSGNLNGSGPSRPSQVRFN